MNPEELSPLSDDQKRALDNALGVLRAAFPDLGDADIVSRRLLPHLLGPLPSYSKLSGYAFNKTTLAAVAANVVCHGIDPSTDEVVVILISRKEKNLRGEHYRGHIGGYVNLDCVRGNDDTIIDLTRGEQPHEGVLGETDEETRDANNQALLRLTPDRLELLTGGINYQVKPPVAYFAYTAELSGLEIEALKQHGYRFEHDDAYRANVLLYNHNEVFGFHVLPLSEAKKISAEAFLYQAAWNTFQAALIKIEGALRPSKSRHPLVDVTPVL